MSLSQVDPGAGLRVEREGAVVTVTLDRPERLNVQTPETWVALVRLRRELPGDVRVVVLRGAGRAFSAGLDRALFTSPDGLPSLAAAPAAAAAARIAAWQEAFDWSSRADLVSVVAVHGHAIGGGFQLALGADIRIVADDVQFAMPEPLLGIVPDLGGTKRLVDLVGYSRALEICLTGRRVGADEAAQIGLASRVVPREGLDTAVQHTVEALLAVDRDAAAETKALLARAHDRSQDEQQGAERAAQHRRLRAIAGLHAED
ncbi:enoyl-CoA hydratase/isomerase family protein [uncultured Jatrophihabitans sp.]|uniref:enoyl-CoA hydratase/isomerase family protein n=1 Tax=uncultured Jatrophihabitans sp. TaxID=1610747 RepID=UPI0035CB6213